MPRTAHLAPDRPDLDAFAADFEAFHARFADLFGRAEPRTQAAKYLRGLLGGVERRNTWQLAEALGDALPDRMQRLLNRAAWSAVAARDRLVDFCVEQFGDPDAVAVLDETGFLKKGDQSVGVKRQYTGTAGKKENCQIGVFLGYAGRAGHVLLDRALHLPASWCDDAARRARARVPAAVRFHTKPQLAARMLRRAWRRGVPMAWVTADEVYGDDPALRATIAAAGRCYVLAVDANREGPDRVRLGRRACHREPRARPRGRGLAARAPLGLRPDGGRVVPIERARGHGARDAGARRGDALHDRAMFRRGQGRRRPRPVRGADVAGVAPPHHARDARVGVARVGSPDARPHGPDRHTDGREKGGSTAPRALAGWSLSKTRRLILLAFTLPAQDPDVRWAWMIWRRRQRELARRSHYKRRGHVAPPRTPLTRPQAQVPL